MHHDAQVPVLVDATLPLCNAHARHAGELRMYQEPAVRMAGDLPDVFEKLVQLLHYLERDLAQANAQQARNKASKAGGHLAGFESIADVDRDRLVHLAALGARLHLHYWPPFASRTDCAQDQAL